MVSCSSHPIRPEASNVKVSREEPGSKCESLGRVTGTVLSQKPNVDLAIADLKKEAALKGANYVKIESASGYETAIAGIAYFCP